MKCVDTNGGKLQSRLCANRPKGDWLYGEAQGRTDQDQITHVMRKTCTLHIFVLWHFAILNLSICLVWTQIQEWIHTRYSIRDQNLMAPEHYMSLLSLLESVFFLLHRSDQHNSLLNSVSDEEVDTVSGWGLKTMRSESAGFSWYTEPTVVASGATDGDATDCDMSLWSGGFISQVAVTSVCLATGELQALHARHSLISFWEAICSVTTLCVNGDGLDLAECIQAVQVGNHRKFLPLELFAQQLLGSQVALTLRIATDQHVVDMKSFQAAQTSFRVKQSEKTTIELVLGESYFFQPSFCYLMPGLWEHLPSHIWVSTSASGSLAWCPTGCMNLGEDDAKARGIGCPLAKRLWPHRHIGISSLFFQNTNRKEHLSGSSVGSWRACFQTTRQQVRVRVPLQHQRCFCFCATLSIISPLNDKPCFENLAFGGLFRFKFKLPCTIFKNWLQLGLLLQSWRWAVFNGHGGFFQISLIVLLLFQRESCSHPNFRGWVVREVGVGLMDLRASKQHPCWEETRFFRRRHHWKFCAQQPATESTLIVAAPSARWSCRIAGHPT